MCNSAALFQRSDYGDSYFDYKLKMLEACDESVDLIVLPEYSDVPCTTETLEETLEMHERYFQTLMNKCVETARRCDAVVFVNALSKQEEG